MTGRLSTTIGQPSGHSQTNAVTKADRHGPKVISLGNPGGNKGRRHPGEAAGRKDRDALGVKGLRAKGVVRHALGAVRSFVQNSRYYIKGADRPQKGILRLSWVQHGFACPGEA